MNQQTLLSSAIQFYATGQINEAEKLFRQILKNEPYLPQANYFLGLIALDKGIYDEACQLFYQATLVAPKNNDYQYSLAVALQECGKTNEAINIYEKLEDMPESLNNLGNIFRAKGDLKSARTYFDKALEKDKNMLWAYLNKALLEREEKNYKKAKELLYQALSINENFIQALYQLSVQNRIENDLTNALDNIEKAIQINQTTDFLWVEYGKVLSKLNRIKEALNAFDNAIQINHFCTDALFEKALLTEETNPDIAEQAYRTIINIDTKNTAVFNNLGALLYKQNRKLEALEMYRNVFLIKPDDTNAAFNLAIALEDNNDYQEAAGLYFKILGQNQLQQQVHIRLANMLPIWFEKDEKTALLYAEGWQKNFPDNPLAVHTLKALKGEKTSSDNDFAYTQTYYNAFAETYDEKMIQLDCQIPKAIQNRLNNEHYETILDLGCGTGACGAFLKDFSSELIGIDASPKMIEIAKNKNCYTKLYTQDILDYLTHTKKTFDLIIAADVFCYIENITPIIDLVHNHLTKTGRFIFTVEKNQNDNQTTLQYNGRYQHGLNIIKNTLIHFKQIDHNQIVLRQEKKQDCIGYLFDLKKG
ncbi:MAG: tetratricopeptide repeat protein [Alphaproteobacteria bacterium]|nr:tetratricopeptide repeat protein [Alphaproteobacteria bacterium]